MTPKNMEWLLKTPIAHRGLHDDNRQVPENSLLAFHHAIEKGYPIELDVHLLADGSVVAFHDTNLKRMCGADARITNLNRHALANYQLVHTAERIPLIEEVCELVGGKVPLLIEMKASRKPGPLETALHKKLQNYQGEYALQSFNPFHMAWFAQHAPHVPRVQLASGFKAARMALLFKESLRLFMFNRLSKPHFIGYHAAALPNKSVSHQRSQGRPVLGWTVRSQEEYEQLEGICDNIIFEGFIPQKPFPHLPQMPQIDVERRRGK